MKTSLLPNLLRKRILRWRRSSAVSFDLCPEMSCRKRNWTGLTSPAFWPKRWKRFVETEGLIGLCFFLKEREKDINLKYHRMNVTKKIVEKNERYHSDFRICIG